MVAVASLWLPILVSAVIVFVVSSVIHMVLPYHRSDYRKVPSQDEVMDALRKFNIPPGDYMLPRADTMADMGKPEFVDKLSKGPVAIVTFMKYAPSNLGVSLVQWFLYSIVVGIFSGYVAGRAVGPGASYLTVFRFAGTTAFAGYALASWQNSIWYKRSWSTTIKITIDGLIYALMTGGTFGWLWPR